MNATAPKRRKEKSEKWREKGSENRGKSALHIASVAHHEIDYLLTWNCKHIANARILPSIYELFERLGIYIPIICTPEELLAEDVEDV